MKTTTGFALFAVVSGETKRSSNVPLVRAVAEMSRVHRDVLVRLFRLKRRIQLAGRAAVDLRADLAQRRGDVRRHLALARRRPPSCRVFSLIAGTSVRPVTGFA